MLTCAVRFRHRLWIAAGLVAALLGPSCGKGEKKQRVVAFSQANNAEPYRAAQNALMEKLFAAYPDVKLAISDAQQDNSRQVAQVETFIRQKPDLLIVAPNERAALTAVMGQAMAAGIPVICLERDILQPNYTSYVHSDNVAIGRLAGRFIVDRLTKKHGKPRGRIVALRGLLGVEGEINRERGAKEIFDQYPDIQIVAHRHQVQVPPEASGAFSVADFPGIVLCMLLYERAAHRGRHGAVRATD